MSVEYDDDHTFRIDKTIEYCYRKQMKWLDGKEQTQLAQCCGQQFMCHCLTKKCKEDEFSNSQWCNGLHSQCGIEEFCQYFIQNQNYPKTICSHLSSRFNFWQSFLLLLTFIFILILFTIILCIIILFYRKTINRNIDNDEDDDEDIIVSAIKSISNRGLSRKKKKSSSSTTLINQRKQNSKSNSIGNMKTKSMLKKLKKIKCSSIVSKERTARQKQQQQTNVSDNNNDSNTTITLSKLNSYLK